MGWWWFFLYKEYVFLLVFVRLFDMCSGGSICLVMKPAPLQLQALGANHPEPNKTTIQHQENLIEKQANIRKTWKNTRVFANPVPDAD